MGRRPSGDIDGIRGSLRAMVSDEFRRAGQRFISARYLSEGAGLIIGRPVLGVSSRSEEHAAIRSLDFCSASKASRVFGELFCANFLLKMEALKLALEVTLRGIAIRYIREDAYPILWETPRLMNDLSANYRFSRLHNKPPAAIGSSLHASMSVDDFRMCAPSAA
jgi:hypothetical protein